MFFMVLMIYFFEFHFFRFIKGFINRHKERCPENEYFLDYVRYSFLTNLRKNLPKNVLDKSWPTPPAALTEVGRLTVFMELYVNSDIKRSSFLINI